MIRLINGLWKLRIWQDTHGQDMIEYALMATVVALAAGATLPNVAANFSQIFSRVGVRLSSVTSGG